MQLTCNRCNTVKDAEEFLKRKAKEPYSQKNVRCCKECNRKRNKERYHENPEVREKLRVATKNWTERNREKMKLYHKRYETKHIVKRKAKDAVNYEIRKGRLKRGVCEVCGTDQRVHAHHDSYEAEQWLNIRWLCQSHHKKWHMVLDPLKVEGEGKKTIDKVFIDFVEKTRPSPRN